MEWESVNNLEFNLYVSPKQSGWARVEQGPEELGELGKLTCLSSEDCWDTRLAVRRRVRILNNRGSRRNGRRRGKGKERRREKSGRRRRTGKEVGGGLLGWQAVLLVSLSSGPPGC